MIFLFIYHSLCQASAVLCQVDVCAADLTKRGSKCLSLCLKGHFAPHHKGDASSKVHSDAPPLLSGCKG